MLRFIMFSHPISERGRENPAVLPCRKIIKSQASVYGSADRNEALASLSTEGSQRDKSLFHLHCVRFLRSGVRRAKASRAATSPRNSNGPIV